MTPPTKITPALHAYLTDWLAWVDRGAPDGEPYWRYDGLCSAAYDFDRGPFAFNKELYEALGRNAYPFGGQASFQFDVRSDAMHLNEARLAWCRSTLATAEIEG